jgi:TolA-binding protein
MYVWAEARFWLWDMQVRERQLADAVDSARQLSREFPDNQELRRFLETHAR